MRYQVAQHVHGEFRDGVESRTFDHLFQLLVQRAGDLERDVAVAFLPHPANPDTEMIVSGTRKSAAVNAAKRVLLIVTCRWNFQMPDFTWG